jgi:hypothetical protein
MLTVAVSSISFAGTAEDNPGVSAARGEGDPITLGDRNPGSGESTRETAIVANAGNGGLVLRPSNTAKGGRAVSATCDNDGQTEEDGCAVYVNKGTGAAATFRTQGSVPFAIRETNNGRVAHLNADMIDGLHASDLLTRADANSFLGANAKAVDAEALDGQDSSAFLGVNAKAADANTLDGKDSTEFLGATSKAADANTFDGRDSTGFARVGGRVGAVGTQDRPGYSVIKGTTGIYTVNLPAGTFTTGASCPQPVPMIMPFATALRAAIVTSSTCVGADGSGSFGIEIYNAAGNLTDSEFFFMVL